MDYKEADKILSAVMEKLEQERCRQGLTLQRLGLVSGVSRTAIGLVEKGKRSPSLIICLRLADALGLRLGDLLNAAQSEGGPE